MSIALRPRSSGEIEAAYRRCIARGRLVFLVIAFLLAEEGVKIRSLESFWEGDAGTTFAFVTYALALALPIMVLLGNIRYGVDLRDVLFGRVRWWSALFLGLACAIVVQFAINFVARFFSAETVSPTYSNFAAFLFYTISDDVLQPVAETIVFQMVFQTVLLRFGNLVSIILSAIAFCIIHLTWIDVVPTSDDVLHVAMLGCGLVTFVILRATTRSTLAVLTAHSTANAISYFFAASKQLYIPSVQ